MHLVPAAMDWGNNTMIYRRDNHNRSLDDYAEARQKAGAKAGRRAERAPRAGAEQAVPPAAPALAAAAVK
jgi:hypothetical protein